MDARTEIREFLTSRRARITPEQAGLVSYGSRRVPGLRREEVAVLAGVSVPYYTRIERGDMNGVSDSVLEALARALQLDDAERAHLRDLSDLGGELSTKSDEFRTRWAAHNVRFHDTGTKDFHHPVVGDLTLTYNRMDLAADPGQMLMIWTAEPGSKSAQGLSLLGSWAATPQQPELHDASDHS